jgi:nucleoside-diphosphate-sugar epimerase
MIYISGINGFIGQHFAKRLECKGIPRDATQQEINELLKDAEYVIHLASYGNHSFQTDPLQMIETNVKLLIKILKATDKKVYNISSSSVYLKVKTHYANSKLLAQKVCESFPNAVTVHPYSVYGEGEAKHKFIPTVINALKTGEQIVLDKEATHDWIHVEDFIDAILAGETEIGTGIKTANIEIVMMLENISNKKLNYICSKMRDYDNDNWVCPKGVKHIHLYDGLKKVYDNSTT